MTTHSELIERTVKWCFQNWRVYYYLIEPRVPKYIESIVPERPDIMLWFGNGSTAMCEIKISESDSRADRKKAARDLERWAGFGDRRFLVSPEGVKVYQPIGWGHLIEQEPGHFRGDTELEQVPTFQPVARKWEAMILAEALKAISMSTGKTRNDVTRRATNGLTAGQRDAVNEYMQGATSVGLPTLAKMLIERELCKGSQSQVCAKIARSHRDKPFDGFVLMDEGGIRHLVARQDSTA